MFVGVDLVIMGWDKGGVHTVALDVCFDSLGAFIVHYVEHGCISAGIEVGENVHECCNHDNAIFGWHGADKDGIQVVNVDHKHILHVVKR